MDMDSLTSQDYTALAGAGGVMALFMAYIGIVLVIGLIVWIVTSIPLYSMASKAGVTNAWLAWLPIGNMYVLCMLGGDEFSLFGDKIHFNERINAFWVYLALSLGGGVIAAIPLIGWIASCVASIFVICITWRFIYDWMNVYNPGSENMGLSIVALLINLVFIILLWVYKNRTPSYPSFNTGYNAGNTYDTSYTEQPSNNDPYNNNGQF